MAALYDIHPAVLQAGGEAFGLSVTFLPRAAADVPENAATQKTAEMIWLRAKPVKAGGPQPGSGRPKKVTLTDNAGA